MDRSRIMSSYTYTSANVTYDPYYTSAGYGALGSGTVLTTTGSSAIWQSTGTYSIANDPWKTNPVKITSKGMEMPTDGDIKFGNVSLKETLESIDSRLAILRPDPKLEKEWDELRALGDAYRKLEKEIQEKMKTWEVLKQVDDK